ncbi:MAG: hypothetical protein J7K88_08510 [Candidatus Fermentibacteraceae bacterium]|nr:hypothetical protein [Candidatus Fermentibacteraceae bacterium]
MRSRKILVSTALLLFVFGCSKEDMAESGFVPVTRTQSLPVIFTDTLYTDSVSRHADGSRSNISPLIGHGVAFLPVNIPEESDRPPSPDYFVTGETGIVAVDISTLDTLWSTFIRYPPDQQFPYIGSMHAYRDSLIIASFLDGLYLFNMNDGSVVDTIPYDQSMQLACDLNAEFMNPFFAPLVFVSNGNMLAYFAFKENYNKETNRVYDIEVVDSVLEQVALFTVDFNNDRITTGGVTFAYEGLLQGIFVTDSSLCFYTVAPELFIEITFDGRLVRNLFLGSGDHDGPVLPLAPPYFEEIHTRLLSISPVMENGHLYTLRTGISLDREGRAELIDTDICNGTSKVYVLNTMTGWKKLAVGEGFFVTDWFIVPEPDENGEYPSSEGKREYAFFRL